MMEDFFIHNCESYTIGQEVNFLYEEYYGVILQGRLELNREEREWIIYHKTIGAIPLDDVRLINKVVKDGKNNHV